jgi:hypothetical protein
MNRIMGPRSRPVIAVFSLIVITAGGLLHLIYFNRGALHTVSLVVEDGGTVLATLVVGHRALELQMSATARSLRLISLTCFVSLAAFSSAFILRHFGLLTWNRDVFYSAIAVLAILALITLMWPGFFWPQWRSPRLPTSMPPRP